MKLKHLLEPEISRMLDAASTSTPTRNRSSRHRWRWAFVLPMAGFALMVVVLALGLQHDPRSLPSPLIDKPVPRFDLPAVRGRQSGLADRDLLGEVSIVNVFASWCVACREEHPILVDLARRGVVPIHGLNYKDKPDEAARWLDEWGDPYTRTGADQDGRVGIDWGVYGVPETFLINADGRIILKHIGPLTAQFVRDRLEPEIERLRRNARSAALRDASAPVLDPRSVVPAHPPAITSPVSTP